MFNYTPLQGAQTPSNVSQSILELDSGVKILVDVGWDDNFNPNQLHELERHLPTLSFILLTHATTSHLGAFAHLSKNNPLFSQIPVYATEPVIALGRTLLQDIYSSTPLISTFLPSTRAASTALLPNTDEAHSSILKPAPSADEITRYFERITALRYSQPHQPLASDFSPPVEGLSLTAYSAGHTLGGTIWHIQYGMESVIYAVDWNQARENVIGGAAWFGGHGGTEVIEPLRKPTALVCSSRNGDSTRQSGTKRKRDAALLDHIRSSISKDGTVLIPSDSSGRMLELAYVLERAWQQSPNDPVLKNTRVYLASRSASATVKHAQSLLEWMDEAVVRDFEATDDGNGPSKHAKQTNGVSGKPSKPFEFQNVRIVDRPRQLEKALNKSGPKVILASDSSLTWGLSKSTLMKIADKVTNLVVLTDGLTDLESAKQSLGSMVWDILQKKEDGVAVEQSSEGDHLEQIHTGGKTVSFRDMLKMPLNQSEQQTYQQYLATQRQLQSSLASANEAVDEAADIADDASSSTSSNESDDEYQGRALNVSAALGHAGRAKRDLSEKDLGVSILLRKSGVYDFDVRQFKRGRNAVFPYIHHRKRGDAFGEYIKPEDFLRAEEREDANAGDLNTSAGRVGQKRKWDEVTTGQEVQGTTKSRKTGQDTKMEDPRTKTAQRVPEVESSDESEPEPEKEIGPGKASFQEVQINLNARLAFVDYSGIHDQRSLRNLIELIDPRKLILVGGTKTETDSLAVHCKAILAAKDSEEALTADIFTPSIGETIDASVDTNAWTVKLSRGLVKRLAWQNVHKMGIAALSAELKGEQPGDSLEAATKSKKAKLGKAPPSEVPLEPGKIQPLLDLVSSSPADTRSTSQPLYVGDMRLADLRRLLGSVGYSAEFRGEGTLLINGIVAVKKLSSGRIIVEGSPIVAPSVIPQSAGTFYDVRRTIYERLAIIAGG